MTNITFDFGTLDDVTEEEGQEFNDYLDTIDGCADDDCEPYCCDADDPRCEADVPGHPHSGVCQARLMPNGTCPNVAKHL